MRSLAFSIGMLVLAAACGPAAGDEATQQVEAVVRAAAGNTATRVWDIRICRDDATGAPLNAVGLVGGSEGPRAWYVEWRDGQPSSNVDIEFASGDAGMKAYYGHFRNAKKGDAGCRNVKAEAFRVASPAQPDGGAAPDTDTSKDSTSHFH